MKSSWLRDWLRNRKGDVRSSFLYACLRNIDKRVRSLSVALVKIPQPHGSEGFFITINRGTNAMKNKALFAIVIYFICSMLLAGCGKSAGSSDISDMVMDRNAAIPGQGGEEDLQEPSGIRVLTGDGEFAEDWEPTVMSVDPKGNMDPGSAYGS